MGISNLVRALESGSFFRQSFKWLLYFVAMSVAILVVTIVYSQFGYANKNILSVSNESYISVFLSIVFVGVSLVIIGLIIFRARRCELTEEFTVTALTIIMVRLAGEIVAVAQLSYVLFAIAMQFDSGPVYNSPISEAFLVMPGVLMVHVFSASLSSFLEVDGVALVVMTTLSSMLSAWLMLWLAYAISESMLLFKRSADNLGVIAKSNIQDTSSKPNL